MARMEPTGDRATIEECIEEIEELLTSLERYDPQVLAAALATHLEALLSRLHAAGECSSSDVRELLAELGRGALES